VVTRELKMSSVRVCLCVGIDNLLLRRDTNPIPVEVPERWKSRQSVYYLLQPEPQKHLRFKANA